MRALVTGCRGFVGVHLTDLLLRNGVEVYGLYHEGDPWAYSGEGKFHLVKADITEERMVHRALDEIRPDYIYHLAGITSVPYSLRNPRKTFAVNAGGARNIFESVRTLELQTRILNVSSAQVYGSLEPTKESFDEASELRPTTPYAASKIIAENLARCYVDAFGLDIITVRPFNHIGPGQPTEFACSDFAFQIARIRKGLQPPVLHTGDLEAERDFTDVRDVVEAYWVILEKGATGSVYNVCSGKSHSLRTVAGLLSHMGDVPVDIESQSHKMRSKDNQRLCGDATRIRRELGWAPRISLQTTLADLLNYWTEEISKQTAKVN